MVEKKKFRYQAWSAPAVSRRMIDDMAKEDGENYVVSGMTLLNEQANRAALLMHADEEILKQWFKLQFAWWGDHAGKLKAAIDKNWGAMKQAKSIPHGDPRWPNIYTLEIRYEYATGLVGWDGMPRILLYQGASGFIGALRKRQHVLVCINHGINGVKPEDWSQLHPAATPDGLEPFYEALAYRGCLNGEFSAWEKYCEKCLVPVFRAQTEEAYEAFYRSQL